MNGVNALIAPCYNIGYRVLQTPFHLIINFIRESKMTNRTLTQLRLKELLNYCPLTGNFIWIAKSHPSANSVKIGAIAGNTHIKYNGKKYIRMTVDGSRKLFAHHLVWLYIYGELPKDQIDHINGNGCDNRIANLRLATSAENSKNMRKSVLNTSGITGVSWLSSAKKWMAGIKINRKSYNLGTYNNFNDAVIARKMAEYDLGFHRNHGETRPL